MKKEGRDPAYNSLVTILWAFFKDPESALPWSHKIRTREWKTYGSRWRVTEQERWRIRLDRSVETRHTLSRRVLGAI